METNKSVQLALKSYYFNVGNNFASFVVISYKQSPVSASPMLCIRTLLSYTNAYLKIK